MTREEAIEILNTYDVNFHNADGHKIRADKICEACDMGVKALKDINEMQAICEDLVAENDDLIDENKALKGRVSYENATYKEPCEDCISRQDLIDSLNKFVPEHYSRAVDMIIEKMPSVKPTRAEGYWKPFDGAWYQCSKCGAVREQKSFMEYFCPNCGADMRGEEE